MAVQTAMLTFHDVPKSPVPLAPPGVGRGEKSLALAQQLIATTWKLWFALPPPTPPIPGGPPKITVDIQMVADEMAADDGISAMPLKAARTYCRLYLREVGPGANAELAVKPWVGTLPSHHRRAADELLAVGLSLATAKHQGYQYFASRRDVNSLLAPAMLIWKRIWPGNGPDYVLDTGAGHIDFLEIKGQATNYKAKPVAFAKYKAQSLNADILGLQDRHLLSYAYFPAQTAGAGGGLVPAAVQWFNASNPPRADERVNAPLSKDFISLAIAFCQFQAQLCNAGYDLRILGKEAEAAEFGFETVNGHWIERGPAGAPSLVIAHQALNRFRRISELISRLRDSLLQQPPPALPELRDIQNRDANRLEEALRTLFPQGIRINLTPLRTTVRNELDEIFSEYKTQYRYATGIHIVSRQP